MMNPEAHGTYQRPLHVFKYMHLHEYMKGKSQAYGGAAGVLGSGAVVRDTKRTLHIGASSDQDQEMKLSAGRVRSPFPVSVHRPACIRHAPASRCLACCAPGLL